VRERLERGRPLLGTFLQSPSTLSAELVSGLGLDFVCVEAEHSGMGRETVQGLVAVSTLTGTPALVRVSGNAQAEIAAALDAGAAGVIVPRVDSAAEAAEAVRAARFPPAGGRGVGPGRAARFGQGVAEYFASANDAIVVGVQIESAQAVSQAAAIAGVEGVDFVFVGPGDLAASLGLPFGDERVNDVIASVLALAGEAGRPAGIWAPTAQRAADWLRAGFRMVILGSDLGFLAEAVVRALAELEDARG
jgi:4-hydroxy-2-oxoheptanedioate aldolase